MSHFNPRLVPIALLILIVAPPVVARAEPATTVAYPVGATATRYTGLAFDTCTAPSLAQMTAWQASPYRGLGIYIGGPNRTCAQPQLTASWVKAVTARGWRLIPIYMGRQAPCTFRPNAVEISPSSADAQGVASARDAITRAKALGIWGGSAIYGDMEHYLATDTGCRTAVLRYLSGWTRELHRQGYLSAVYAHLNSGAQHLTQSYTSSAYARPDALWIARWDGNSALTNWAGIPNNRWAVHQRAKQYRGDHNETHGGVTLNIDSDRFDAPVASVAYNYRVTSSTPLAARTGPSPAYPAAASYPPGAIVPVMCQVLSARVGTTSVWNKLGNGLYVTDYYVSTPSNTGFSAPLPQCTYPYQATAPNGVTKRRGPGTSYQPAGVLPTGGLAWINCQRPGTKVGTTAVWDRLDDQTWVSDYFVATPSKTTFTKPILRC